MIEYFIANLWQAWLAIAIICLIVELCSGGFFIVCFSIGAVFGALASFIGGFYVQLFVFIIFSTLSIFLVRPFALKYLHRSEDNRLSNADALIGRIGTVSQTITPEGYGRVAIDGDDWKAQTDDEEEIPTGVRVRVVDRDSIIIKVTKSE